MAMKPRPSRGTAALEDALGLGRSLRARLVVGALLAVIVLTGLAIVFAWRQYSDARRDALASMQSRAILAASVLDAYFAGQLSTLSSIAQAPAVVETDIPAMTAYFRRVQPPKGTLFPAGLGWIDRKGFQRATSTPSGPVGLNLAERSYFKNAIRTGKPFVSEAVVARLSGRRLLVMSVPTRDAKGLITGVLAGGMILRPSQDDQRTTDLGFAGIQILDRMNQQLTLQSLAPPANRELVTRVRADREGVLSDTDGLDGAGGHVVAYATSPVPGWKIVLDQPASSVFASARHALRLALILILGAVTLVLALIAWALVRSRRELRGERAQLGRWAGLTRSLNEATDSAEICSTLASSVAAEFPQAVVAAVLAPGRPEQPADIAVVHGDRTRLSYLNDADAVATAQLALRRGEAVARETGHAVRGDEDVPDAVGLRVRSLYGAVLADAEHRSLGAVVVCFASERALVEHERSFVQAHADQAAQALARIRRHEDEHDTAIRLQQSLLPERLPETAGLAFAAHYQTGSRTARVGGDWYDVLRRPDGILQMTVGDVAGRGIPAAVLMGQLRNAFRAYAQDVISPSEILQRMSRHVGEDQMATAVCVTFDPCARQLAYATAGHPPPLLLDEERRTTTRLDGAGMPPLGWRSGRVTQDLVVLVPDAATLVLYTDGLVERRGTNLETGIEHLSGAIAAHPLDDLDRAAADIVGGIVAAVAEDDAALLLVRMSEVPAELTVEIPSNPAALHALRPRLRAWMLLRGLEQQERDDALLALSEACNNAIEHAYDGTAGTISVFLRHDADVLRIVVDDEGTWRAPRRTEERGRGLLIMRSLMQEAEVIHKRRGTRVVLERRLESGGRLVVAGPS
jgi:serine phosphatase RsbU (regulator of sigma subunit)/anti-sigma regulatory factor (Ser/Thr protein kinase)